MKRIILLVLTASALIACEQEYTPKPIAYARIELPEHTYRSTMSDRWNCPYTFEFSKYSVVTVEPRYRDSTCWYNIYYPKYRATIHLTYSDLRDDLGRHIEENRKLAMKHISKATQINEANVFNPEERVFGIIYDFRGETASDLQFFLTDSTDHFLRGALYFSVHPNKDSLDPVINYVKRDIEHMIETFEWTNTLEETPEDE